MKRGVKSNSQRQSSIFHKPKKAQMTLFIILGIVIFVLSIAIYAFMEKPKILFKGIEENPEKYIQLCLEDNLTALIDKVSIQGGSLNPEFYYEYQGGKIATLCYTSQYYKTCTIQEPFLKQHIERELLSGINPKVEECFDSLKKDYKKQGYEVQIEKHNTTLSLLPGKVLLTVNNKVFLTKKTTSEYSNFRIPVYVDLYTFVGIASSMIEWEAAVGDVNVWDFMLIYHNIDIRKFRGSKNRKIYIIKDRTTGKYFQFASRSLAFPAGLIE